ncbi:DUF4190 domain-containing protein [Nocardia halotolerans]|uniref:DUF4190 domain-containing protein n=1 Tax=Nocardia halotolerans TaxID=1755878 RepID=A0ABV8VF86_9NOCA
MSVPPPPQGYLGYFRPPDHPQSTLVLVLGVLGLALCGLCAPFAWVKGRQALTEIDAAGGTIGGRSQVYAGYIMGIVGSAVLGMMVLLGLFGVLVALAG